MGLPLYFPRALVGYGLLSRELGDFSNNFLVVFGPLLLLLFVFGDAIERGAHRVAQKIICLKEAVTCVSGVLEYRYLVLCRCAFQVLLLLLVH